MPKTPPMAPKRRVNTEFVEEELLPRLGLLRDGLIRVKEELTHLRMNRTEAGESMANMATRTEELIEETREHFGCEG